jgi:hypothetical protein
MADAKFVMTLGELRELHGAEGTGGWDYCICNHVLVDKDQCFVHIDATVLPTASKTVVALTALNTATEGAKCGMATADVDRLGLAVKVKVEVEVEVEKTTK